MFRVGVQEATLLEQYRYVSLLWHVGVACSRPSAPNYVLSLLAVRGYRFCILCLAGPLRCMSDLGDVSPSNSFRVGRDRAPASCGVIPHRWIILDDIFGCLCEDMLALSGYSATIAKSGGDVRHGPSHLRTRPAASRSSPSAWCAEAFH